jgi:arylsulfatase A-like enzyme
MLLIGAALAACLEEVPYNIVVFLTDDQRFDTVWAMPELAARISNEAVQFPNAVVSTPLCCPSRTELLTGYPPSLTNIHTNGFPDGGATVFTGLNTLATRLQAAGYQTALIGKYLNHYELMAPQIPPGWSFFQALYSNEEGWCDYQVGEGSSGATSAQGKIIRYQDYITDQHTDRAKEFLRSASRSPFFLLMSYVAPHEPHTPHPDDTDLYLDYHYEDRAFNEDELSDKPARIRDNAQPVDAVFNDMDIQSQLQSLVAVDRSISSIIQAVADHGRLDHTLFVFFSDNGLLWGEHQLLGKRLPYEESIRVPLAIWGANLLPGTQEGLVEASLDVSATLSVLTGLEPTDYGNSLVPALCGEFFSGRSQLILQNWRGDIGSWAGVLTKEWKYIEYEEGGKELYQLQLDPYEEQSLHKDYQDLQQEFHDTLHANIGLALLDTQNPEATVGQRYTLQLSTWGGTPPLNFALAESTLPPGLELSASGLIEGTPLQAGTYTFWVSVTDSSHSPYDGNPQLAYEELRIEVIEALVSNGCSCQLGNAGPSAWVSVGFMSTLFFYYLLLGAPSALAQSVELMPVQSGYQGRSTTVSTKGVDIPIDSFISAILDGNSYPKTATYFGVPALLECKTLAKLADGTVIVYQRTGGNSLLSSRHYVIGLKVTKKTDTVAELQWYLVKHTQSADGSFSGPYASTLNANKDKAVYTPYNHGTWRYDKSAGTIYYAAESDPGGSIPSWAVSDAAVMAFPLELIRVKWGIQ